MNDTNRVLNRIVLFVLGLILAALGTTAVLATTWSPAREAWDAAASAADEWFGGLVAATTIGATTASWAAAGALVLLVLLIALLLAMLGRLISRRSKVVLRSDATDTSLGRVVVREEFASDALKAALGARDDVVSVSITAREIRRRPVMQIVVTLRRNADPRALVTDVDRLVTNLATLTGQTLSTYISVHSGLRARFAPERRRLT